jgi:hypothetical protein
MVLDEMKYINDELELLLENSQDKLTPKELCELLMQATDAETLTGVSKLDYHRLIAILKERLRVE